MYWMCLLQVQLLLQILKKRPPSLHLRVRSLLCLNFASAKTCQDMLGDARIYDDIRCSGTFC